MRAVITVRQKKNKASMLTFARAGISGNLILETIAVSFSYESN